MTDLFNHTQPAALPFGIKVKLDRDSDRARPCCSGLAIIYPGKSPHAAEFRCATCGQHRGWAPKATIDFITETIGRFGAPPDGLIVVRQQQQEKAMEFDNTNRGALFRNNDKTEEKHPDYRGNLNVDGTEYWLSAWIKTSKKGMKFMSLSVEPKTEQPTASKKPIAQDLDDVIPFN